MRQIESRMRMEFLVSVTAERNTISPLNVRFFCPFSSFSFCLTFLFTTSTKTWLLLTSLLLPGEK